MSAFLPVLCFLLILASPCPVVAAPKPPRDAEQQRILASGQIRLGNFYRDREQVRLTVDGTDRVTLAPAQFDGYQFQGLADLDVRLENSLSDEALIDMVDRLSAEYDSPDDIQAGRYTRLDNRFRAIWGLALDLESTLKLTLSLDTHADRLFPRFSSNTGAVTLALDTNLDHDAWLTFSFSGLATQFNETVSDDYREGQFSLRLHSRHPERIVYRPLPEPVQFPQKREVDPAFTYGTELGLYRAKRLFPLGTESLIGQTESPPLSVGRFDRLFAEDIVAREGFTELELNLSTRDYDGTFFPDWRRAAFRALHHHALSDLWGFEISDTLAFQSYQDPDPGRTFADRLENHARLAFVRTDKGRRDAAYIGHQTYQFPGHSELDFSQSEIGTTGTTRFGTRYGLVSDFGYSRIHPEQPRAGYPDRDQLFSLGCFTVDFSEFDFLAFTVRYTKVKVPRFTSFFETPFDDTFLEAKYHRQITPRLAASTGVRSFERTSAEPARERHEDLIFLDAVVDL